MRKAWYVFFRFWVILAVKLFYRRIEISGYENFPKTGPVLIAPNHQNAFMDALVPAVFARRPIHFLARADVFNTRVTKWLFHSFNMLPVYRQRDGLANLAKNDEVFEQCHNILRSGGVLLIFPEAGHLGKRKLRTLSKGFTRIAFGSLEANHELDIQIVPLGLNYSNYEDSQSRLIINIGKPVAVNNYLSLYSENPAKAMTTLRNDVQNKLEKEMVHIIDEQAGRAFDIELNRLWPFYLQLAQIFSKPNSQHNFYKNREQSIQKIDSNSAYFRRINIYDLEMEKRKLRAPFFFIFQRDIGYWIIQNILLIILLPIYVLSWIMHAPTYFLISRVLRKYVKDRQFYSSFKLVGALFLFPIFMVAYGLLAAYLSNMVIVICTLLFFPLSIFIIRELRLPYRYLLTMWRMLILRATKFDLYKYLMKIEEDVLSMVKT